MSWEGYSNDGPSYVKKNGTVTLHVTSADWSSVGVSNIKVVVADSEAASVTLESIADATTSSATLTFTISNITDDCKVTLSYIGA